MAIVWPGVARASRVLAIASRNRGFFCRDQSRNAFPSGKRLFRRDAETNTRRPSGLALRALPRNRSQDRSTRVLLLMMRFLIIAAALICVSCSPAQTQVADFAGQRERMVKEQIVMRGLVAERVLSALRKVPREEFVPAEYRAESYTDKALPIGYDQTISQPYIVAFMTEELRPQPRDRVLEVGTGSGYQAAILAELVAEVYTIEIIEPLAKKAEATLQRLGYRNVHVKTGDGYKGWPERAPFDSIIVTCAPERVPQPLLDQLKEGGRMIIPVGAKFAQELYLFEKKNGRLQQSAVLPVRFVPMLRTEKEGEK
jgi:protein-L-isoaspartate(D-aspartate) O-methyltransferase